jgi:hypothetical protein
MPTVDGGTRDYGSDDEGKLKVYKQRLRRADKDFDTWSPGAKALRKRYRHGVKEDQFTPEGHRVVTSVGIGEIDAMFSSLTAVQVDVLVKNIGTGQRDQARLAEAGIAEVMREQKVGRKYERAVKDSLLSPGIGWLKVSYDYAEEEVDRPRSSEDVAADVDAVFEQWRSDNELRIAAGKPTTEPPSPREVASRVPATERVAQVKRDRIVVDYVHWEDVRWDPAAHSVEDIRWMSQYTHPPLDEVRTDPAIIDFMEAHYGPRKARKMLADLAADATVQRRDFGSTDDGDADAGRVTLVTFYDFDTGTVCTFPRNGDFILNETANPFAVSDDLEDRNPFVPLVLRTDGDQVRGISDMELMAPTLDELQNLRADLDTYISRTVPKVIGPEGALTEAGKAALLSREWGAFIELTNGTASTDVGPLNPPPLPQEVFSIPEKLVNEIREATGSSELSRGVFPEKRQTATATMQVAEAGNIRQAEKRNRLEGFFIDIARRILFLMQVFYDAERVSRIIELDKDVEWSWNAEDVVMEAKLEVFLSPKETATKQTRRDNAIAWVNLLLPLPSIDANELVRWGMEEGGLDLELIRRFLKNPEEMQREQMAALQLQGQEQAVASGEAPDPAAVPGPASAEDLAGAVNPGTIPPEVAAALAMSGRRDVVPE